MPYIKQRRRHIKHGSEAIDCGELNFLLTMTILEYLEDQGERYQTYNDIIGVLECIKQELYRRKIAPYEDKKIKENGDVY